MQSDHQPKLLTSTGAGLRYCAIVELISLPDRKNCARPLAQLPPMARETISFIIRVGLVLAALVSEQVEVCMGQASSSLRGALGDGTSVGTTILAISETTPKVVLLLGLQS